MVHMASDVVIRWNARNSSQSEKNPHGGHVAMLVTPYTPPDPGHQVHRIRNQSGLLYSSIGFLFVHSRYILYPPVISVLASFRLLSAKLICSGFGSLDYWILSRERSKGNEVETREDQGDESQGRDASRQSQGEEVNGRRTLSAPGEVERDRKGSRERAKGEEVERTGQEGVERRRSNTMSYWQSSNALATTDDFFHKPPTLISIPIAVK
ncbi:hypothetical protein V8E54_009292 [Elaphomyces granulatus]